MNKITFGLGLCLLLTSCFKEVGITVTTDFIYTAKDSIYTAPANISFTNRTIGATNFKWTFENGEPANATAQSPPDVTFTTPGTIIIDIKVV